MVGIGRRATPVVRGSLPVVLVVVVVVSPCLADTQAVKMPAA
jgi:hypothetical protein